MMPRGGHHFEKNSSSPGALRFDSDNRTSSNHFRQQFSRQFDRHRPDSAGRRLAAATAVSTDFYFCNSEYAGGRRLATAAALSTDFYFCNSEYAGGRRLAAAAALSTDFYFCNSEYAGGRRLAAAAALSTEREPAS